jgi:integrase
VLYVEREHVGGETKAYLKTIASRRSVPLTAAALNALDELPARLDSPLLFPAVRGGYLNLRNWRSREWDTAVESAGLAVCKCRHLSGVHDPSPEMDEGCSCTVRNCKCGTFERSVLSPVPYVLRHTFASNALAAGVGTFELARVMGTSLEMIERTYGHLVRGADDAFRSRLDAFAADRVGVEWASVVEGDSG